MTHTSTTRTTTILTTTAAALLALTACSGGDAPTQSTTPAAEPTETRAGDFVSPTPDAYPDTTEAVQSALSTDAAAHVTEMVTPEEGRVQISTDLIDDRDDAADADSSTALEICNAAAGVDGVTYVAVYEEDGTNWILYGHPMVPEGECGEV